MWITVDQYLSANALPLHPGATCRLAQVTLPYGGCILHVNCTQAEFQFVHHASDYRLLQLRFAMVTRDTVGEHPENKSARQTRDAARWGLSPPPSDIIPFASLDARAQEHFYGYEFMGRQGHLYNRDVSLPYVTNESLIVDIYNESTHVLERVRTRIHIREDEGHPAREPGS